MKNFANRVVMVAAGAIAAVAMVYGQTEMTAQVPFAFNAQGSSLPAGNYRVYAEQTHGGTNYVRLWNVETKKTVVALSTPAGSTKTAHTPKMVFRCSDDGCALSQIWTMTAGYQYKVSHHGANEHVALVEFHQAAGE